MISPIKLTPTMDQNTMISVLNANFAQIESENRTKVITDENGDERILIGREPNGHYVIAIVGPNKKVLQALQEYYDAE